MDGELNAEHEAWEERAAIMEYEGGMERPTAEAMATKERKHAVFIAHQQAARPSPEPPRQMGAADREGKVRVARDQRNAMRQAAGLRPIEIE